MSYQAYIKMASIPLKDIISIIIAHVYDIFLLQKNLKLGQVGVGSNIA